MKATAASSTSHFLSHTISLYASFSLTPNNYSHVNSIFLNKTHFHFLIISKNEFKFRIFTNIYIISHLSANCRK